MGNIISQPAPTPTHRRRHLSDSYLPPSSSWYKRTVDLIHQLPSLALQKITRLAMQFFIWAFKTWMSWKGFKPSATTPATPSNMSVVTDKLQSQLTPPSSDTSKKLWNPLKEENILSETLPSSPIDEVSKTPQPTASTLTIPPFTKGAFSAHIKESSDKNCLVIDQITIPESEKFKAQIEFCRDLIISTYIQSEERGYKGSLRIETTTAHTNHLFRFLGCETDSENMNDPELVNMHELTGTFASGFALFLDPQGEDLILCLPNESSLHQACKLKKEASQLVRIDTTKFKETSQKLQGVYKQISNDAKQRFFDSYYFLHPDNLDPITRVGIDGIIYLVQFSYEITTSSMVLKNIRCEELDEMDTRSKALSYAKALWSFLTMPKTKNGKISITTPRKVFAHTLEEARIYCALGFVPASKKQTLLPLHSTLAAKTKDARRKTETPQQELEKLALSFPNKDQQTIVRQAAQKVKNIHSFKEEFQKASSDKAVLYQILRIFTQHTAAECFKTTKVAYGAYRGALDQAVSSLDFSSPQEFVIMTDPDQNLWTESHEKMSVELAARLEFLIQEELLYQNETVH